MTSVEPNPTRPGRSTRFCFQLPAAGPAQLTIHDLNGRLVRHLVDFDAVAGNHEALWDGLDRTGCPVPAGIYCYRLSQAGGGSAAVGRVIRLR